ncbi:tetratricopeptide repeat-containing sensor histidine kinase [Mucilaginibacter aquaedulcis]|uniref:tetratricopeptide repeat-containing sensor histidine kinase n=1 Tax=Mucilaginibacter aquaedulcis TaxID=1187081 RepID=UPI0025B38EAC|nr:sensor histidine kinase [Mucilaginibacter aquaedulcis]MDN3548867.1 sensor histidine kinase [Mucilaginibacter aquaedulcis]
MESKMQAILPISPCTVWTLFVMLFCLAAVSSNAQYSSTKTPRELLTLVEKSKPDTNKILLLLQLGDHFVSKPGNLKSDLDSAFVYFKQAKRLSETIRSEKWRFETLKSEGNCYLEGLDLVRGKSCFMQVINYYKLNGDKKNEAKVWLRLQQCIPYMGPYLDEKEKCFRQAIGIYKAINDTLNEANVLKATADLHLNEGKLDLAENELLEVIAKYKAVHYKKLHHTYFLLSAVNRLKGNLDKELFYNLETIAVMEATADTAFRALFLYETARTYRDLGRRDQSLYYYNKVTQILLHKHPITDVDKIRVYGMATEIVQLLLAEKKPYDALLAMEKTIRALPSDNPDIMFLKNMGLGLCYGALKDYKKAELNYMEMIKLEQKNVLYGFYDENKILPYKLISDFFIEIKQYDKAIPFLKQLEKMSPGKVPVVMLSEIQLSEYKIDSAAGQMRKAIEHYKLYKALNDSAYNEKKSKQIAELEIKYETTKKEKDLKLLKATDKLRQRALEQADQTRKFYLAGMIMSLIIIGVGYGRFRAKQRSNLLLETKQKEITSKNIRLEKLLHDNELLIREVHHRVKNNLQVVMSLLSSQSVYLRDEAALAAVMESQHRVQAMSLIHQKLYKTDNHSTIYMPDYINDLVDYLKDSYQTQNHIYFDRDIEPIYLDVSQAVPLGLILNETITNAIKHAFPNQIEKVIRIRLITENEEGVKLIVSDNGFGIPDSWLTQSPNSFGITLMRGLAEDLDGSIEITNSRGTTLIIVFKIETMHGNEQFSI